MRAPGPTRWRTGCWASLAGLAENVLALIRDLDDSPLGGAFAVQLVQRLRDQDASITPALDWLNRQLARSEARRLARWWPGSSTPRAQRTPRSET